MHVRRLIVLALLGIFVACAGIPVGLAQESIVIGYTCPSFDISDVYEQYMLGMEARLDELGIDYTLIVSSPASETDHAQQLTIIEDFVIRGVDYIVIGPTDFEISARGIQEAHNAGIPALVVNYADPHTGDIQAHHYAGYQHYDGARIAAAWIANYLNCRGKIALIYGIPGAVTEQRGYVFKDIMEHSFPDIEIVFEHYAQFSREMAYEATVALLQAHPDVDLIHAISTSMAMGSLAALREVGLVEQIPVIGWGGTVEEMDSISNGALKGSVGRLPRDVGASIADAIWDLMNDRTPPLTLAGPLVMLDSVDSIRRWMPADYYVPPQDR